ncbi:hypothetical protein C8Q79DRAFT_30929 [Trametes meyenii]|nr:hypothetical protein C8Q79DRAFT_30929 [Trametes meyenii]
MISSAFRSVPLSPRRLAQPHACSDGHPNAIFLHHRATCSCRSALPLPIKGTNKPFPSSSPQPPRRHLSLQRCRLPYVTVSNSPPRRPFRLHSARNHPVPSNGIIQPITLARTPPPSLGPCPMKPSSVLCPAHAPDSRLPSTPTPLAGRHAACSPPQRPVARESQATLQALPIMPASSAAASSLLGNECDPVLADSSPRA